MEFDGDTLQTIYAELKPLEIEIEQTGQNIKRLAKEASEARAEYERLKNNALIEMYSEESKTQTKRTEAHRTAIYRSTFSQQRLLANLAENSWKAEKDFLSALQSKLMSAQTRVKILEADLKLNNLR